jgi:hypothetical protein
LSVSSAICDLVEAAVGVGERNDREQPVATGVIADLLGRIVVPHPRQPPRRCRIAEPYARRRDRYDRGGYTVLVHDFERLRRRPGEQPIRRERMTKIAALVLLLHVLRRHEMVMNVDPRAGRRVNCRRLRKCRICGTHGGRGEAFQKASSRDAATARDLGLRRVGFALLSRKTGHWAVLREAD